MNKQQKLVGIVVAAAIIIVGAIVLVAGGKSSDSSTMNMNMTDKQSSSSSNSSTQSTADAVMTTSVEITNFAYSPAVIKVKVGDTVTWTNKDGVRHNVVADSPSSDAPNGPLIAQGETYTFKFTKAGTYTYHCEPHPYMHGTVVVE